jgi:hypothetical protein
MSWSVQEKYRNICEDSSKRDFAIDLGDTSTKLPKKANQQFCKDLIPPDILQMFSAPHVTQSEAIKTQAAMLKQKCWAQHQTLHIKFIGGTQQQRAWVQNVVMRTFKDPKDPITNLQFQWLLDESTLPSEIRISFDITLGSWSFLGTDCLTIPKTEATMNLAWMDYAGNSALDGGVIKHEFGHCLGPWIHECTQARMQSV